MLPTNYKLTALDDFAGTGWGVACQRLNIAEAGVELMPEAVATREKNGMRTIGRDVWEHIERQRDAAQRYDYTLYIASPPCQTFSMAGNGAGRAALDTVVGLIDSKAYLDVDKLHAFGDAHDPRSALVLAPLVRIYNDAPLLVVLEQVPPVLPIWERYAIELRSWGYSVWVGILNAEQYGAPQTRRRAVLIARADGKEAKAPTPTHSRYYPRDPKRLDPGVQPWVSMSEALGWGMTQRPYLTISGGANDGTPGGHTGGQDPAMLGGSAARARLNTEQSEGRWLTSNDKQAHSAKRRADQPAPTITGGHDSGNRVWSQDAAEPNRVTVAEASALQTYPPEFVWMGAKGKQFLQIGNAVPPLLAEAILREVTN